MKAIKKNIPVIATDECKGCERCVDACPKKILKPGDRLNDMGFRYVYYSGDACIGCGACFYACPEPGAITILEKNSEDAE